MKDSLLHDPSLVVEAIKNPELLALGLDKIFYNLRKGSAFNRDGIEVTEEDWDTLILLDACRYDIYQALSPFDGEIQTRESRGSNSHQFVRGNFMGKKLHDLVVVSGNQWYLQLEEELDCEFHAYYDVERDAADGLVPSASAMNSAVRRAREAHPNKRLLIHYMQPHHPFVTNDVGNLKLRTTSLYEAVRQHDLDVAELRSAYRDNLEYVLEYVKPLVEDLDGKTIISSDHGELLGERLKPVPVRWFGHPGGIYSDLLVTVPWHVVKDGERRTVISEQPDRYIHESSSRSIEANLKALGYT